MKAPKCKVCGAEHWSTQPHEGEKDVRAGASSPSGFVVKAARPEAAPTPQPKRPKGGGGPQRPVERAAKAKRLAGSVEKARAVLAAAESAPKPAGVGLSRKGRPPKEDGALSSAERAKAYRARKREEEGDV